MLSHASLPPKFWDHAFLTAIYLINRLPTTALNFVVPYTLFNQPPDYKFQKAFGCTCFLLLRLYNSHKLDFRSQECLFLGYSTSNKGYMCLSSSARLFISKDVRFNESRFPYHDLFPSLTPAPLPTLPSLPSTSIPLDISSSSTHCVPYSVHYFSYQSSHSVRPFYFTVIFLYF